MTDKFNWDKVPKELYTRLGNSGLEISKIILGCMSYGNKTWFPFILDQEDEVMEMMKKAYDSGIRTFDTACNYSNGDSERFIGLFLKKYNIDRRSIVILSKCYYPSTDNPEGGNLILPNNEPGHEYRNRTGLSRRNIIDSVEGSVERLGTHIDVLQIHRFDPNTPIEETMEALHDVVKSGKVRYIGASTMRAYQFVQMQSVAEAKGWTKFISMQGYYSLLYRDEEDELIAYCKKTGVGLIPWSPLAGGVLARPLDKAYNSTDRSSDPFIAAMYGLSTLNEGDKAIINRVEELAKKYNVSMAAISSAWCIARQHYPILGLSKPSRIDDALQAIKINLTEEELKYLEEPYLPRKLPHLFR
ncbi:hypothetical protein OGAPHI_004681 [Ogataea philodendri]|uniref:NADP-dependent oxidoreductase domain-containing protein n=1 Tax=Ogataea philodendri TaxID=1378263 RepID=A0A9P8P2G7_9ASCO|nr:uncharacterized protein OGAPHI_004681 [Ogataea philodendri]KAH3663967.1 hypothetical protein OGAPHI_004681 [Ogataea philodendri]